jgi:DNA-binding transcriptional ArsR family regulator
VFDPAAEIDHIQIGLIRALAGIHRLRIVHLLGRRPMEVRELAQELAIPQATVSQNLAAMRAVGLVDATRDGRAVRYRLADPEILAACDLMRSVIVRRLSVLGSLAAAADDMRPRTPVDPLQAQVTPR